MLYFIQNLRIQEQNEDVDTTCLDLERRRSREGSITKQTSNLNRFVCCQHGSMEDAAPFFSQHSHDCVFLKQFPSRRCDKQTAFCYFIDQLRRPGARSQDTRYRMGDIFLSLKLATAFMQRLINHGYR